MAESRFTSLRNAFLTGLLLTLGFPDPAAPVRLRLELAYGYTALFGWVTLTITAIAFKLFPLWVWRERFLPEWGKRPVPAVASLYSHGLRDLTGTALLVGVLATAAAIIAESESVLRISLPVVLAGMIAFVVNFARTARWALLPIAYHPPAGAHIRRRPVPEPPPPSERG